MKKRTYLDLVREREKHGKCAQEQRQRLKPLLWRPNPIQDDYCLISCHPDDGFDCNKCFFRLVYEYELHGWDFALYDETLWEESEAQES